MTALRHDDYDPIPPDALDDLAREILRESEPSRIPPHRAGPMGSDLPSFLRAYDAPPPPLARRRRGMPLAGKISLAVLGIALAGVGSYAAFVEISHSSAVNTLVSRLTAPASRQVDLSATSSTTAATQPDSLSRVAIAFAEARDAPAPAATSTTREVTPAASPPPAEQASQAPRQDQSFSLASIAPTAATTTPPPAPAAPPAAPAPSRAPEVPVAALGPATAPAPTAPSVRSVAPARSSQSARLVTRARSLITETGDIAGARLLLEKAAEMGDPDAAFLLAETHDHAVLMRWRVVGPRGDVTLARRYYEQALAGGIEDARLRLSQLGN